jgi:tetratricopeptide (TPR) repeat protein
MVMPNHGRGQWRGSLACLSLIPLLLINCSLVCFFSEIPIRAAGRESCILKITPPLPPLIESKPGPQEANEVRTLVLAMPVQRELAGGGSHSYRITLAPDQYLRVVVAQRGINVIVKLLGPDSKQITEVNNQNNVQLQEEVALVAEAAGEYRLDVSAVEKTAVPGNYEIRISELRDATAEDHSRVPAERAYAQGELFRLLGSAESLHKAIVKYEEALPLWREMRDRREEATTLHSIGLVNRLLGDNQKALEYYNQALPLRREAGDVYGEAMTTHNIGAVYWNLGDNQKALDYYSQALALRRAAHDIWGESVTLNNIGAVYGVLADNQTALDYYNRSLPLRREARDRAGEGETLGNMSTLYARMGELPKSLDYANQSLNLRREAGDKRGEASALNNIASIYFLSNQYREALEFYSNALSLTQLTGDRRIRATALSNIGAIYIDLG